MSNIQRVKLPPAKPDCCAKCPLLGLVPKSAEKPKYSKKSHLCIGLQKAMTEDKANKRESECTDPKHPLQRPCDLHWDRWMTYPHQIIKVNKALYRDSRDPYLETRQYTIDFDD